jgi:peptidyl-prolyl cis-trans isomerase B (cyclophilin B)
MKPGRYQVEAHYNNTTGQPQDSMVVMGMFYEDNTFQRPDWFLTSKNEAFCGISENKPAASSAAAGSTTAQPAETTTASSTPSYSDRFPLFNEKTDGPLLTEAKRVELDTSEGKIHLELDPKLAPKHATQLYHLLTSGSFNGTPITRYEPNFVLQVALAETKSNGNGKDETVDINVIPSLRRLPLEVSSQDNGNISHTKWVLSMARYDEDTNSAVSSFSIILADSHHLDKKYTIFGRVIPDAVSVRTIDKITEKWRKEHPVIITAKSM